MGKKFILLAIMAVVLLMPGPVFAAGSLFYAGNPSEISSGIGDLYLAGTQAITGQCNVQSITISGTGTTALDYVEIYDATSATGTAKHDISVGTAGDTVTLKLNDAIFGTGVFVKTSSNDVFVSIEYTQ